MDDGSFGWTAHRLRLVGVLALGLAVATAAVMASYAMPWFAGVAGASAVSAPSAAGVVGPHPPTVPALAGVPLVVAAGVLAGVAGLAACAARNAVLCVPAVVAWLVAHAAAGRTVAAWSWGLPSPPAPAAGWELLSAALWAVLALVVLAGLLVAAVNQSVRRESGAGSAALAGMETVLMRGAASRADAEQFDGGRPGPG